MVPIRANIFRTQPISWIDLGKDNRLGKEENLTDRLNLEAVEFIRRNKENPFFLYLLALCPAYYFKWTPRPCGKISQKHPSGKSGRENVIFVKMQD